MSRYIDVNVLEDMAKQYSLGYYEEDEWAVPFDEIHDAPSIDIVFCEECKKSKIGHSNGKFYRWCFHNIKRVKDNDFCSDGKRRI